MLDAKPSQSSQATPTLHLKLFNNVELFKVQQKLLNMSTKKNHKKSGARNFGVKTAESEGWVWMRPRMAVAEEEEKEEEEEEEEGPHRAQ